MKFTSVLKLWNYKHGLQGHKRKTTWTKILFKSKLQIAEKEVQAQKRLKYSQNQDYDKMQQNAHKVD